MADPWAQLDSALFASPFAVTITYVPAGGGPVVLPAVLDKLDEEAALGGGAVEQHVQAFRVRKADLPGQPRRGDLVEHAAATWYVGDLGESDPRGRLWTFRAERAVDR